MIASSLWLSLKVTAVATVLLFLVGLALGYLLARVSFRGQLLVEVAINLPLVLPPTIVGYYLLLFLGRSNPLVAWLGLQIVFTWQAIAIASAIMGLPLMVQASRAAIASVDRRLEDAARTLGASELDVFLHVTAPLARRGVLAGLVLGSTRALGEFGATVMVAGNIPGQTQTMPLAIYDAVQNRQYGEANWLVVIMTALACFSLIAARRLESAGTRTPPISPRRDRA